MTDFSQSRRKMVDNQLRTNDVTDHRILDAMELVPRERFVPASKKPSHISMKTCQSVRLTAAGSS